MRIRLSALLSLILLISHFFTQVAFAYYNTDAWVDYGEDTSSADFGVVANITPTLTSVTSTASYINSLNNAAFPISCEGLK